MQVNAGDALPILQRASKKIVGIVAVAVAAATGGGEAKIGANEVDDAIAKQTNRVLSDCAATDVGRAGVEARSKLYIAAGDVSLYPEVVVETAVHAH